METFWRPSEKRFVFEQISGLFGYDGRSISSVIVKTIDELECNLSKKMIKGHY
jgi:hypothetical protein